jgi:hypothetical protein
VRWQSDGNANAYADASHNPDADAMPSKAEQSISKAEQTSTSRADDPADTYWTLTGKYPTDKTLTWIDDLAGRFGSEATSKAMAATHQDDGTVATLLGRVKERLTRDARQLDRSERLDESARLKEKRARGINPGLIRQRHNTGQHADAPDPQCRDCRGAA